MGFSPPEFENILNKTERKNIQFITSSSIQAKRRPLGGYVSNEMSSILLKHHKLDFSKYFRGQRKIEVLYIPHYKS